MPDFPVEQIAVNYHTDLWGAYAFEFPICSSVKANDGMIPFGDTISAMNVRAFIGLVEKENNPAGETEITSVLIDPSFAPFRDGNIVYIKLQHPGAAYNNQEATLVFEITLASGGTQSFYFHYVAIGSK